MSNEKDLAVQQPVSAFSALKSMGGDQGLVGLEAMNASDISLPKIKLMQATSPEVQKSGGKIIAGQFYNTLTQEAVKEMEIIPLSIGKSMVMWKKPFKRGEEPLCKSYDGISKTEGCGDGKCDKCKHSSQNQAVWNNLKEGETKPPCTLSYVIIAREVTTGMPFRMIASGASVGKVKNLINQLIMKGVNPFCTKVTMKSITESNDFGVFNVLQFDNLRENDDLLIQKDGNITVDVQKYNDLMEQTKNLQHLFSTELAASDTVYVDPAEESASTTNQENGELY